MSALATFEDKAPWIMEKLIKDFDLTNVQAASILGNLGHESNGFTQLQEVKPLGGGRGGLGWAQWTGARRLVYEGYCRRANLDPKSDKANYAYLFAELKGSEKAAIEALKKTSTIKEGVEAFERKFERAGVKHYPSRERWANIALARHTGLVPDETTKVQERLIALGLKKIVGEVDGIYGDRTKEAVTAFQLCHGNLVADGIVGPLTKEALFP